MPVISERSARHNATLALPSVKAGTSPADRSYPVRLTQGCPGSDQVGHAGGGREPSVCSEASGDGEDTDLASLQAPRSSLAAGGAEQVEQQAEEDGTASSQEDNSAGEHAVQIFSVHFGKGIIKKGRAQTQIFSEMALCGYLLLKQHSTWQTCQTNHALQDINSHGTVSVSN